MLNLGRADNPHEKVHLRSAPRGQLRDIKTFYVHNHRPISKSARIALDKQFPVGRYKWADRRALDRLVQWYASTGTRCKAMRRLKRLRDKHAPGTSNLKLDKNRNVIYACYHVQRPGMMYVGQSIDSAFNRFKEHVSSARNYFRYGNSRTTTPFHRHIANVGWEGLRLFPLEQVVGTGGEQAGEIRDKAIFREAATPREIFWKRVLHAFAPQGYVQEHKKARPGIQKRWRERNPDPPDPNTTRILISARFTRKLKHLLKVLTDDRWTENTLSMHSDRNVKRMIDVLTLHKPVTLNTDQETFDTLRIKLVRKYYDVPGMTEHVQPPRTHIVQLYLHRGMGDLGVREAIMSADRWQLVPEELRTSIGGPPMTTYKFEQPISMQICNYTRVSGLSQDAVERILEGECACGEREFAGFINKDTGHVLTTDCTIMDNKKLCEIMAKGTKYRCDTHRAGRELEVGAVMNNLVYADLERALNKWRTQMETQHGFGVAEKLKPWAEDVIRQVKGDPNILRKPEPEYGNTLTGMDVRRLGYMQRRFCFSTVDKAAGNYSIQCKKALY